VNPDQLKVFAEVEERHWWFVARRQIFIQLVEHLVPPHRGATILDIGCGTGGNTGAFGKGYRCVGVDASSTAIDLARKDHPGVEFIHAPDATQLDGLIRAASVVLITDVIEHVADDFLFFSRIAASVRVGGYILLTVPADMSLWSKHDESNLHFRRYDMDRLQAVWNALPIETKVLSYFNSRLYPVVKLVRWANRVRGRSLGNAGMDLAVPPELFNRILTKVLGGESSRLLRQLEGGARRYEKGVSLIAVLERREGEVAVRSKPASVAPDPYSPA